MLAVQGECASTIACSASFGRVTSHPQSYRVGRPKGGLHELQFIRADALGVCDPLRGAAILPRRSTGDPLGALLKASRQTQERRPRALRPPAAAVWRWWSLRISLSACAAIAALLTAELAVRVIHPIPFAPEQNMVFEADPDTGYRIKPGGSGRHANGVETVASSQGLRNREVRPKGPQDYRVLVLGDSFTVGSSVEQQSAYPQVLERVLGRETTRPVEVINAGVGGWDPFQYAQYFAREGFRFEPDLVLVGFFVGNDTYSKALSVDRLPTSVAGRRISREAASRWSVLLEVKLYEYSHLARAMRPTLPASPPRRSCDDFTEAFLRVQARRLANHLRASPERVAAAKANVDQILRIRDHAAERGVPVVVALLPDETQVNQALQSRLLSNRDASRFDFSMPQALLSDLMARAGLPVVDLLAGFRADSRCLYDNTTHWNSEGHVLAAELIGAHLAFWLPKS